MGSAVGAGRGGRIKRPVQSGDRGVVGGCCPSSVVIGMAFGTPIAGGTRHWHLGKSQASDVGLRQAFSDGRHLRWLPRVVRPYSSARVP